MNEVDRFLKKVRKCSGNGCWDWLAARGKNPDGSLAYGQFHRGSRGATGRRMYAAHRVAWELFVGRIPDGMKVLHRCDNQACVRPEHLFLGTQADNVADMIEKGRKVPAVGERQWNAKLTVEQIAQIRREYRKGIGRYERGNARELAARFGVKPGTITDVCTRSWGSVT